MKMSLSIPILFVKVERNDECVENCFDAENFKCKFDFASQMIRFVQFSLEFELIYFSREAERTFIFRK